MWLPHLAMANLAAPVAVIKWGLWVVKQGFPSACWLLTSKVNGAAGRKFQVPVICRQASGWINGYCNLGPEQLGWGVTAAWLERVHKQLPLCHRSAEKPGGCCQWQKSMQAALCSMIPATPISSSKCWWGEPSLALHEAAASHVKPCSQVKSFGRPQEESLTWPAAASQRARQRSGGWRLAKGSRGGRVQDNGASRDARMQGHKKGRNGRNRWVGEN